MRIEQNYSEEHSSRVHGHFDKNIETFWPLWLEGIFHFFSIDIKFLL